MRMLFVRHLWVNLGALEYPHCSSLATYYESTGELLNAGHAHIELDIERQTSHVLSI